jgi:hypothetical protein
MEITVLRAGKPISYGGYTIVIDAVNGNALSGIKITGGNGRLEAKSGEYKYMPKIYAIRFKMLDGAAEHIDPQYPGRVSIETFKEMMIVVRRSHSVSG